MLKIKPISYFSYDEYIRKFIPDLQIFLKHDVYRAQNDDSDYHINYTCGPATLKDIRDLNIKFSHMEIMMWGRAHKELSFVRGIPIYRYDNIMCGYDKSLNSENMLSNAKNNHSIIPMHEYKHEEDNNENN